MNKKLIISALCILMLQVPNATFSQETNGEINVSQKTTMQKIKRGADIYFKITDRLELNFNQQRKAFGIKMEEMTHLGPLMSEIAQNETKLTELLATESKNEEEIKKLNDLITLQKAVASQKKRYYISRYRGILTTEQNHKLDELIFDIANGYLKL